MQAGGAQRIHAVEAAIFQLQAHLIHTQTVGNRGVNFQGFFGNAALFVGRHSAQGTHVVQTVSELDQYHAQVIGHGQGHLLKVFGLFFGVGFKFDLGQLGYAVHQIRHRIAKLAGDCFFTDAGIFNHVVQHGRHQALMIHVHGR